MKTLSMLICASLATAGCDGAGTPPSPIAGADPGRGRAVIAQVGCGACHEIPGVRGPRGRVGPSLAGVADRALIGGRLPNRPEVLALWVRDAPSLSPQTGMPPMPLTASEARDAAAYLLTLHAR